MPSSPSEPKDKWSREQFYPRTVISIQDKEAIAAYYRAEMAKGRTSVDVLIELSDKYRRSSRQLQRYISEVRKNGLRSFAEDDEKQPAYQSHQLGEQDRLTTKPIVETPDVASGALLRTIPEEQSRQVSDAASTAWRYEHVGHLLYFSQCLGEWLSPYAPQELAPGRVVCQDDLWFRSISSAFSRPRDYLEKKVAEERGVGRCDLRKHSLFKCFQQHFPEPSCWSVLEQVADRYRQYLEAGRQAYDEVLHWVKPKLVEFSLSEADAQSIADSLMTYAYYDGNFQFHYELHQSQHEGQISWDLKLNAWDVGDKEDPEKLKLVLELHQGLVKEVRSWEAIQTFIQEHADAQEKTDKFRQYLKPILKLENLLQRSYCDWCR